MLEQRKKTERKESDQTLTEGSEAKWANQRKSQELGSNGNGKAHNKKRINAETLRRNQKEQRTLEFLKSDLKKTENNILLSFLNVLFFVVLFLC